MSNTPDNGHPTAPRPAPHRLASAALPSLFVGLAVLILIVAYISYRGYEGYFRQQFERELSAIAELKISEIVHWRGERLADAAVLQDNVTFSALVRRFLQSAADTDARDQLQSWLDQIRTAYNYDRTFLLDLDGIPRIWSTGTPEPINPHLSENVADAIRTRQVSVSDLRRETDDQPVRFEVLVPILDAGDDANVLGVLVMRIDPALYLYPLINHWPVPSQTGETFIVRRDGDDALYLTPLRFQRDAALHLRVPLSQDSVLGVKAALGQAGIVEGVDYRDQPVIGDLHPIPDSPWFLVARMDIAEVYAPLGERVGLIVLLVSLTLLMLGAAFALIGRWQSTQFYRQRYEAEAALREGEARFHRTLDSMLEGCQILGFDWRYVYINDAAARHGRLSKEALLGHTLLEMYPGIEASDVFATLRRSMEQRVTQTTETEFVFADGKSAFFDLSIQPVPEGIFILSYDITERKRSEARVAHLNSVLRALRYVNHLITRESDQERLLHRACELLMETRSYQSVWAAQLDNAGQPLFTTQAGISGPYEALWDRWRDGHVPTCVTLALDRPGLNLIDPAVQCKDCPRLNVDSRPGAAAIRLEYASQIMGILVVTGPREFLIDEEERVLLSDFAEDLAFGLHSIALDKQQQRMVKELSESEARYRLLAENATDVIWTVDNDLKFTYVSPSIRLLRGLESEEAMRESITDTLAPGSLAIVAAEGARLNEAEAQGILDSVSRLQIQQKRKDGSLVWVELFVKPLRDEHGQRIGFQGVSRDITDRRRAEDALRHSEERYRKLVEMSPIAVYVDRDRRIEYANSTCLALLGASSLDQIVGRSIFELFHPDYHDTIRGRILQMSQSGVSVPLVEEKIIRLDGTVRDVEAVSSPFSDHEGEAIQVVLQDITERKQAAEEIRRLAKFPSENPYPVLRLRHDGLILYANRAGNWLLEEWACAVGDSAPSPWHEAAAQVFANQTDHVIDFDHGEQSWTFVVAHVEGEDYVNLYGKDITKRKRAEDHLRRYAQRLAALNRLVRIIASGLDLSKVYDAFVGELLALVPAERTSLVLLDETSTRFSVIRQWTYGEPAFAAGEWMAVAGSAIEWMVEHRAPFAENEIGAERTYIETPGLKREGLHSRLLLPLLIEDRVAGLLTIGRYKVGGFSEEEQDTLTVIADHLAIALQNSRLYAQAQYYGTQMEERVRQRTAELETANHELESFSYSVSHDLRAPLRAVDGFSRILLEDYAAELSGEAQRYLHLVRENAQQMGSLIDDLLSLSRLGRQPLNKQTVLPANVVQDVLPVCRLAEAGREIEVVVGEMPACQADPALLRQVFVNLISNAFKYTRSQDKARVDVGCEEHDGENAYFVRDNGVGFDSQYADKVFGVFQRLHRAEDYEGTGVGLAIVQRIVHRHGGRVWAESEVGQGATFFFTLGKDHQS